MTPSERERRIDAAVRSWIVETEAGDFTHSRMGAALDAADKVVPIFSEADRDSLKLELEGERHCHRKDNEYLLGRMERAEAAARDFAKVLGVIARDEQGARLASRAVLARHPSFSGEEGSET